MATLSLPTLVSIFSGFTVHPKFPGVCIAPREIFAGHSEGFLRFTSPRITATGSHCVDPRALGAILRANKAKTITSTTAASLTAQDPNILQATAGECVATVNLSDLRDALAHTVSATARDNSRYAIAGVFLRMAPNGENMLQCVATDGHRLHAATVPASFANLEVFTSRAGLIISEPHLSAFLKLTKYAANESAPVHFHKTGKDDGVWIIADLGEGEKIELLAATIAGNFPPVDDVTPKAEKNSLVLTVNKAQFISAVKIAAAVTDEDASGVLICAKGGRVRIGARGTEGQAFSPSFPGTVSGLISAYQADQTSRAAQKDGELPPEPIRDIPADFAYQFSFSPAYILAALATHEGESFALQIEAYNRAFLIADEAGRQSVIMPVKFEGSAAFAAEVWAAADDQAQAEAPPEIIHADPELTEYEKTTIRAAIKILREVTPKTKGRTAAARELAALV